MHSTHEAKNPALGVNGPAPVDPYLIGKKLGFDSMPAPKKRPKGTVVAKGWPGVGDDPTTDVNATATEQASDAAQEQGAAGAAGSNGASQSASAQNAAPASRPFVPFDPDAAVDPNKPNPFANRKMPSSIGNGGAKPSPFPSMQPARPADGGMDIADIFGTFGVSMDDVQEE